MKLNPVQLSVSSLFEGRLFRIPQYQRAYSWQAKQRADLFRDIEEAHRTGRDHFMATVVGLARERSTIATKEYRSVELVDGQQRITTLVTLLKSIEMTLLGGGEEDIAKRELRDLIVKGNNHSLVLLQTNHDSSSIFLNYIRSGILEEQFVQTRSDRNIIDAAIECQNFVANWAKSGSLMELLSAVRNRLSMIYHELEDESTVYRVFEVLNSRGLDVKWIDKTKSQFMASLFEFVEEGARKDSLHEMQSIWQDIYRILGLRQGLGDEALRFAGTFCRGSRPNRIISEQEASSELIARAGTKLAAIVESANWLKRVVKSVNDLNLDNRRAAVTKVAHARFLAIAIMLRDDLSNEARDELLVAWERVTFRIFGLGGADARMKTGDYVRLGWDVISEKIEPASILTGIHELGAQYNLDQIIRDENYWRNCYDGWAEELRYLLYRYDEYIAMTSGEEINRSQWNKIWAMDPSKSIEHIVPQSMPSELTHHLGNLTMLLPGVNSSLKDALPHEKAARYQDCGLKETIAVGRIIEKLGDWPDNEVVKRAERIEAFVRSEWG